MVETGDDVAEGRFIGFESVEIGSRDGFIVEAFSESDGEVGSGVLRIESLEFRFYLCEISIGTEDGSEITVLDSGEVVGSDEAEDFAVAGEENGEAMGESFKSGATHGDDAIIFMVEILSEVSGMAVKNETILGEVK